MKIKNMCMLLLTALIWGTAFVAQSVGMDYLEPFTFNAVRSVIGGLVLLPCIFLLNRMEQGNTEKRKTTPEEKKLLLIGGICCGICLCAASNVQQIGVKYTTVGKAGFVTALYIVIVPVLGIFLKKKVGARVWVSVAIALIGLYLLCMKGRITLSKGDFLILISAFLFSIHILVIDYFSPKVDGVKLSCIQFLITGVLSGVAMFLFEHPEISSILAAWKPILYAGVLSCGVGYTLQVIGQKGMNPTIASLALSMESVFSVLAGWLVLGQTLSGRELLGCLIMFIAIVLAQLPDRVKG